MPGSKEVDEVYILQYYNPSQILCHIWYEAVIEADFFPYVYPAIAASFTAKTFLYGVALFLCQKSMNSTCGFISRFSILLIST